MNPVYAPLGLPLPPWLAERPLDDRGFLVAAETPLGADGKPILRQVGPLEKWTLSFWNGCAVCGKPLNNNAYGYRTVAHSVMVGMIQDDDAGKKVSSLGGLGHLSCMAFSSMACPYLTRATARLGKDTQFTPGEPRGKYGAIMAHGGPAMVLPPGKPNESINEFLNRGAYYSFGKLGPIQTYKDGDELLDLYYAAVEVDAKHNIDMSFQLPWTDDPKSRWDYFNDHIRDALKGRFMEVPVHGVVHKIYECPLLPEFR